ncbi:hypothetical protein FNV43_RR04745 [Rhamnella rubrinervis]|uniref:Uncharacterized protein n=1 Tax=Rhamnella rubrinervis TaxID=2594499 RepID=A0A8K0MQK1_9ROSA|nr:hypothetical protein FNV43_RR04745 [Rhamnella rubrinervis]
MAMYGPVLFPCVVFLMVTAVCSLSVAIEIERSTLSLCTWESFKGDGFDPLPKKWKGGKNFACNNKIIGAWSYSKSTSVKSWCHAALIALGNELTEASFFGIAKGTARGGVPSARIAVYKVCHLVLDCNESDALGAFDDAISDGDDITTISINPSTIVTFKEVLLPWKKGDHGQDHHSQEKIDNVSYL